jgi:hypothetical protein
MRRQYHLRQSPAGLLAWDVHRLVRLAAAIHPEPVALASLAEIDENYWFTERSPTPREIVAHMHLVNACDLAHPIVLDAEGRVMDGMHRIAKALLLGRTEILACRFRKTPEPDHVGLDADELPYDDANP